MKELMERVNTYIKGMDTTDVSVLKFCLIALGILIGLAVPKKSAKAVGLIAFFVFVVTYIPLMTDFLSGMSKHKDDHSIKIS